MEKHAVGYRYLFTFFCFVYYYCNGRFYDLYFCHLNDLLIGCNGCTIASFRLGDAVPLVASSNVLICSQMPKSIEGAFICLFSWAVLGGMAKPYSPDEYRAFGSL
jgi:hypothetical protein